MFSVFKSIKRHALHHPAAVEKEFWIFEKLTKSFISIFYSLLEHK